MTDNQLHELEAKHGYSFDDLKFVHDSLPPDKQNGLDVIEAYKLSMYETLSMMQAQLEEFNNLQSEYDRK